MSRDVDVTTYGNPHPVTVPVEDRPTGGNVDGNTHEVPATEGELLERPGHPDGPDAGRDADRAPGRPVAAVHAGPGSGAWRNRVVTRLDADPRTLVPHPDNYKAHPADQQQAIAATIAEVGWVGEVYVSTLSGRILDGHARVEEAIRSGQPTVPVAMVDCADEDDEARILATFNTLGQMATQDDGKLLELVNRAGFAGGRSSPVVAALAGLVGTRKRAPEQPEGRSAGAGLGPQGGGHLGQQRGKLIHPVVVELEDGISQDHLLSDLLDEGYRAYAMDPCPSSMGEDS